MYKMLVIEEKSGLVVENTEYLMQEANLNQSAKFESVGMQADGTPVVFDKCGNFGYLDPQKMAIIIEFEQI